MGRLPVPGRGPRTPFPGQLRGLGVAGGQGQHLRQIGPGRAGLALAPAQQGPLHEAPGVARFLADHLGVLRVRFQGPSGRLGRLAAQQVGDRAEAQPAFLFGELGGAVDGPGAGALAHLLQVAQGPFRVAVHPGEDLRVPAAPEEIGADPPFGPIAVVQPGAGVKGQGRHLHIVGPGVADQARGGLHILPFLPGDAGDEVDAQVHAHLAHHGQGPAGVGHAGALVQQLQHPLAAMLHPELHEFAAGALHGHQPVLVHQVHPALAVPQGMLAGLADQVHEGQDPSAVGGEGVVPEAEVGEPVPGAQQLHLAQHRRRAAEAHAAAPEFGGVAEIAGGRAAAAGAQVGQLAGVVQEVRGEVLHRRAHAVQVLQGRHRGGFALAQDQARGLPPGVRPTRIQPLQQPQQGQLSLALDDGVQGRTVLEHLPGQVGGVRAAGQEQRTRAGLPGQLQQIAAALAVEGEHGHPDHRRVGPLQVVQHLPAALPAQVGQPAGEPPGAQHGLQVAQADRQEGHPFIPVSAPGGTVEQKRSGAWHDSVHSGQASILN